MKIAKWMSGLLCLIFLVSCRSAAVVQTPTATAEAARPAPPQEQPIEILPFGGLENGEDEISGMAWYKDTLILLPQYPSRLSKEAEGALLGISKANLLELLDRATDLTIIHRIPLIAPGLAARIEGFEGFEAIAFSGERVFLTIEAKQGDGMMGYLISGTIASDLSQISLDSASLVQIPPQADLSNMSDEALLIVGEQVVTIYEANGAAVNPRPMAHRFAFFSQLLDSIPFPNVEYRLTDATPPDGQGRFWAINYFYPGDTKLKPAADPFTARFGEGASHARYTTVERLVELQYHENGITLTDTPPIQLELIDDQHSRNWEAIALLDDLGFILATDKFPETILAFVAKR